MTSTNETMNGSSIYVSNPISEVIKISLVLPTVMAGVYGLTANSLILYFMSKKTTTNYQLRAFSRRSLIDRFIQSLALSDVLCSMTSLPLYVAEVMTNFINTDGSCRAIRYVNFFFPVITIMNYLFIGIERYLGVYHPLKVPSQSVGKKLILVAWALGAVISGLALPSYGLVRYDLNDDEYTLVCKYRSTTKLDRILFLSFAFFVYILPSTILTTTCVLILKFLRRFRRCRVSSETPRPSCTCNNSSNSTSLSDSRNRPIYRPANSRRFDQPEGSRSSCPNLISSSVNSSGYRVTSMFVSLIFAFIVPYMLFTVYNGAVILLNIKMTFALDYIFRMMAGVLIYANGAVGSSILFYNSSYLKKQLESLFLKLVIPRVFASNSDGGVNLNGLGTDQEGAREENRRFRESHV